MRFPSKKDLKLGFMLPPLELVTKGGLVLKGSCIARDSATRSLGRTHTRYLALGADSGELEVPSVSSRERADAVAPKVQIYIQGRWAGTKKDEFQRAINGC